MHRKDRLSKSGSMRGLAKLLWLMAAIFMVGLFSAPAWAHKVSIFAWVEGDTVHTQSKFSGGKRAQNSAVVVYDQQGNKLLEGTTNEEGEFSFKVPKKTTLKVVLKASMGHLAEWTIPEEELAGAEATTEPVSAPVTDKDVAQAVAVPAREGERAAPCPRSMETDLTRQEIQSIVDKALEKRLAPLMHMLADSIDRGPTMTEIVGGIGYIFGLVGVAMYASIRKRGK